MTETEKIVRVEILQMLIEHELSLGDENADTDFISECVELSLMIQDIKINHEEIEKEKKKLLQIIDKKLKEVKNGSNDNTQNT